MKSIILIALFFLSSIIHAQNRYDIIIDEIMADPSPPNSLPNNEWIELKNVSSAPINLLNWKIGDANTISGSMPNYLLQPDSFVIVCNTSSLPAMSAFGQAISITAFPSLDNDGDLLTLRSPTNKTIHAVNYSSEWYQNELKKQGGWSLEMIDPKNACNARDNWTASTNPAGGTPGKKNAVNNIIIPVHSPQLLRAYAIDSVTIILVFDETIDSISSSAFSNYMIDGNLNISNASAIAPLFSTVKLKTTIPLLMGTIYTITATNIQDCKNNMLGAVNTVKVGLSSEASTGELVINEILFNPRPNAYDYIEIYNASNKIFDAGKIFIANRNNTGMIASIKGISPDPFFILPKEFFVLTENKASLSLQYLVQHSENVFSISSLPSFPDDTGDVVILNGQGAVVDEVVYKENWHFALIDNKEGVSLERIDPNSSSNNPANWHSAASTAGFGTPTYKNSQYRNNETIEGSIEITPKIFSPDNDGHDDFATIQYALSEPGFIANILIYDPVGRIVRRLVSNNTLALKGNWNWDGLDDNGNKLPIGVYIIFSELFNLQGSKKSFKNLIVLAGRLN